MAIVTGNLATFAAESVTVVGAIIEFIPDQPAITGSKYILTDMAVPVAVAVDGSGAFSVNLVPTDSTNPGTYYRVRVTVPDPGNNFTHLDLPDWRLYVPAGGGEIASLLRSSLATNAGMVWVGDTPPDNPAVNTGWLDTDPLSPDYGWYMEWSA